MKKRIIRRRRKNIETKNNLVVGLHGTRLKYTKMENTSAGAGQWGPGFYFYMVDEKSPETAYEAAFRRAENFGCDHASLGRQKDARVVVAEISFNKALETNSDKGTAVWNEIVIQTAISSREKVLSALLERGYDAVFSATGTHRNELVVYDASQIKITGSIKVEC